MSISHLAGPPVCIAGRVVQRCPWCGYKLCDSEGSAAPLNPDGTPPTFPTFPQGHFVRVSEGNPTSYVTGKKWEDDDPTDFCLDLVE